MDSNWIKEVPDYLGFENLEFRPHKLAISFPEMEELDKYRNSSVMDRFKGMIHATMNFGQDEDGHEIWLSVVGGGPTYSHMEDDVYEVWSSELHDPVTMDREEITEHMKLLQGYKG